MTLATTRNPRETVLRQVYVYPANGDEPHIRKMEFSEAGCKHRLALFSTEIDLLPLYGKYVCETRSMEFTAKEQSIKASEGDHWIYYNIDLKLPLNLAIARLVGVNPRRPGSRPMWRGDLVIVKCQPWPGPVVPRGGNHMDWLDIDPPDPEFYDLFLKQWYESKEWENMIHNEQELIDMQKSPNPFEGLERLMGHPPPDPRKYENSERVLGKLRRFADKQIDREADRRCVTCQESGSTGLMMFQDAEKSSIVRESARRQIGKITRRFARRYSS
ncbi:hypothetical protein B0H34DRAFT_702113 [Crassisporium funariophilum]|nr:hypothetical protein B0H34DRAFT_702113 [Crassisporium funariophilum]